MGYFLSRSCERQRLVRSKGEERRYQTHLRTMHERLFLEADTRRVRKNVSPKVQGNSRMSSRSLAARLGTHRRAYTIPTNGATRQPTFTVTSGVSSLSLILTLSYWMSHIVIGNFRCRQINFLVWFLIIGLEIQCLFWNFYRNRELKLVLNLIRSKSFINFLHFLLCFNSLSFSF